MSSVNGTTRFEEPTKGTGLTPNKYHHGRTVKRDRSVNQQSRSFISWDGEGVNIRGEGLPQSYVLFGSSVDHIESTEGLSVFDCLDHIIDTGLAHPKAIHVGFAFSYDANMISQSRNSTRLDHIGLWRFSYLESLQRNYESESRELISLSHNGMVPGHWLAMLWVSTELNPTWRRPPRLFVRLLDMPMLVDALSY